MGGAKQRCQRCVEPSQPESIAVQLRSAVAGWLDATDEQGRTRDQRPDACCDGTEWQGTRWCNGMDARQPTRLSVSARFEQAGKLQPSGWRAASRWLQAVGWRSGSNSASAKGFEGKRGSE